MKLKEKCFNGMSGAYAAMFTPIDAKNRINEEAIDQMVEFGIANGLAGFYLTGSTGAWFLLTPEERKIVWKRAVKAAKGRCKLIAHVGATSTDESVALAKAAAYPEATGVRKLQQEEPVTRDFISYLKGAKLLKGILAGHLHFTMQDRFSPTAVQYLVGGNFMLHGQEILFT